MKGSKFTLWWVSPMIFYLIMNWIVSPPKFVCWCPPNSKCDYAWRISIKEAIKLKWGHKSGVLIPLGWCPSKTKKDCQERGHTVERLCEDIDGDHLKATREVSPDTNHAAIGVLDNQHPKLWENKFCSLYSPVIFCYYSLGWLIHTCSHRR